MIDEIPIKSNEGRKKVITEGTQPPLANPTCEAPKLYKYNSNIKTFVYTTLPQSHPLLPWLMMVCLRKIASSIPNSLGPASRLFIEALQYRISLLLLSTHAWYGLEAHYGSW